MLIAVGATDMRATVEEPADINIAKSDRPATSGLPSRLILSVSGFQPSPNGPVEAVVTLYCGSEAREIGRFGIFPHVAFTAADPSQIQRFGFSLPDTLDCRRASRVRVRLAPVIGDGEAASLTVGRADVE